MGMSNHVLEKEEEAAAEIERAAWNDAIAAAEKAVEQYGLSRVNGMKDYPASVASACVNCIRSLRR